MGSRMRLLIRQRKRIEIFVVVELAVEARWARLGPGLHQDVHAVRECPSVITARMNMSKYRRV
jgi:hypothetical protein